MQEDEAFVSTGIRAQNKKHQVVVTATTAVILILVLVGIALYTRRDRNSSPLPASITKGVKFPLYYPSPLPKSYTYRPGSAKLNGSILFYTLQSGSKSITISEQVIPPNPPDLSHTSGFTALETPAGNAVSGTTFGQPIAIILSNTTLITLTGTKATPSDAVTAAAKTMSSL